MTPLQAARHLAAPGDRLLPLSDGGDGFLECLQQTLGGVVEEVPAADPFGRVRPVPVLLLPGGGVAIECAKVIGLAGLDRRDPLTATSRGLGELLGRFRSEPRIWLGLGGSATVDGGRDWPELRLAPTTVFCDVQTDLADAARLFGPQKGASPESGGRPRRAARRARASRAGRAPAPRAGWARSCCRSAPSWSTAARACSTCSGSTPPVTTATPS